MAQSPPDFPHPPRAPLHFWAVGVLLVLWNCWGLAGAIAAQARLIPNLPAEASEYFERQPLWFVLFADLSPLAGVAGSLALLLQSRWAPPLFLAQVVVLALANGYELAIGTSLLLGGGGALGSTLFLLVFLAAQFAYARWMLRRGVLT